MKGTSVGFSTKETPPCMRLRKRSSCARCYPDYWSTQTIFYPSQDGTSRGILMIWTFMNSIVSAVGGRIFTTCRMTQRRQLARLPEGWSPHPFNVQGAHVRHLQWRVRSPCYSSMIPAVTHWVLRSPFHRLSSCQFPLTFVIKTSTPICRCQVPLCSTACSRLSLRAPLACFILHIRKMHFDPD